MNIPIPTKIPFFVVLPVAIVILIIGFNVCLNSFFKLEVFKSIKCDKSKGYCSVYSITAGDALKSMEKKDISKIEDKIKEPKLTFKISDIKGFQCKKYKKNFNIGVTMGDMREFPTHQTNHHYKNKKETRKQIEYGYNAYIVFKNNKSEKLNSYEDINICKNSCKNIYENIKNLPETGLVEVFLIANTTNKKN